MVSFKVFHKFSARVQHTGLLVHSIGPCSQLKAPEPGLIYHISSDILGLLKSDQNHPHQVTLQHLRVSLDNIPNLPNFSQKIFSKASTPHGQTQSQLHFSSNHFFFCISQFFHCGDIISDTHKLKETGLLWAMF